MTKLKKTNYQFIISVASIVIVVTILAGGVVYAYSQIKLWNNIAEMTSDKLAAGLLEQVADEDADEFNIAGIADEYNFNMQEGAFIDASNTLVSQQNPFSATATLELLVFDIQFPSTSTLAYLCGTSTTDYIAEGAVLSNPFLIDTVTVATSVKATLMSGTDPAGASTKGRIEVGPDEYIVCYATTTATHIAGEAYATVMQTILSAGNTFVGKYILEWFNWPK